MSHLAGIFSRDFRTPVPETLSRALGRSLSRREPEKVQRLGTSACRLFKADFGLLGSPGLVREEGSVADPVPGKDDPDPVRAPAAAPGGPERLPSTPGSITLLAGELLLDDAPTAGTRQEEIERIVPDLTPERAGWFLSEARGNFVLARFRPDGPGLLLATDPLGLRPLFVTETAGFVAFSSVLGGLEALFDGGPPMDVVGLAETLLWGRGLADRTAFAPVRRVPHATLLHYSPGGKAERRYREWGSIRPHRTVDADYLRELHACFDRAVALRRRGDGAVRAFLTGGMDSRAIVSSLLVQGAAVESHCYALPASQDAAFARMFAERVGTRHVELPYLPPPGCTPYDVLAGVLAGERPPEPPVLRLAVDRPGTAWGGEGGSVIMGHVKFTRGCLDAARAEGIVRGIASVREEGSIHLPVRPFRPEVREWLPAVAEGGMVAEAEAVASGDPAQDVFLGFVLHRQTASVAREFDRLDDTRIEPLYPFFDAAFVAKVLEAPREAFSRHRAYASWFDHFPDAVRATPWQVYPGSAPCPVPAPASMPAQWDDSQLALQRARHRRWILSRCRPAVRSRAFPGSLLHRPTVLAIYALTWARIRDYGWALDPAWRVFDAFRRSNGNGVIAPGDEIPLARPEWTRSPLTDVLRDPRSRPTAAKGAAPTPEGRSGTP
jgi:asparagine synthase (glutamine-hydrolysing)